MKILKKNTARSMMLAVFCFVILLPFVIHAQTTCSVPTGPSDLISNASNQIDSRLNLSDPTTGLNMYASGAIVSTTSSPRNSNSWTSKNTPLNFTGVSAWNDAGKDNDFINNRGGATLISPRHFIAANHYSFNVGATLIFFDSNGNPVVRTVSNYSVVPGTDINVGLLDSDVDNSISYFPILNFSQNPNLFFRIFGINTDIPMVVFDKFGRASIHSGNTPIDINSTHVVYTSGPRAPFSKELVQGDSGQPGFLVLNNQPILLFAHLGPTGAPGLGYYIDQINSAIDTMGNSGGYHVTKYDVSSFKSYPEILCVPTSISTNAGVDQTITLPDSASLTGSYDSTSYVNLTSSVLWSQVDGPGVVSFYNSTINGTYDGSHSSFTRASFTQPGKYTLEYAVTLGTAGAQVSGKSTLVVHVNPALSGADTVGTSSIVSFSCPPGWTLGPAKLRCNNTSDTSSTTTTILSIKTYSCPAGNTFNSSNNLCYLTYSIPLQQVFATSTPQNTSTTTQTDTTPPLIYSISASSVTSTGAIISWITNEVSDSQVDYGRYTSYGSTTTLNSTLTTSHVQLLSNLLPNTLYHYIVLSRDASGNVAYSADNTFKTSVVIKTTPNNPLPTPVTPDPIYQPIQKQVQTVHENVNVPPPPPLPPVKLSKNLKLGDSDPEVRLLQQTLNNLGLTVATSGPGSVGNETSIFDENTEHALSAYQEKHSASGLIPSGTLDNITMILINKDIVGLSAGQEPSATDSQTDIVPPPREQGIFTQITTQIGFYIQNLIHFLSNIF